MRFRGKGRIADRLFRKVSRWAVDWENRSGSSFFTIHTRPRRAREVGTWSEPAIAPARCSVVMQGPIYTDHDFTVETFRLYSRLMPGTQFILSTWSDTDPALLAPIRDLGVTVVLSDKPEYAAPFNTNMQIVTAAAGVRRAVADGAEWILKTRTDQRLYAPDALSFLIALAKTFPANAGTTTQKARIIGVGLGSLKFAPYHLSDQTVFGTAEDMLAYWTPPLRTPDEHESFRLDTRTIYLTSEIGELCRHSSPECYFGSQFLKRIGRGVDWTIADSWAAYRDHFCVADLDATDFYWVKGQTYSQREHTFSYDALSNRAEMGFRDWLLLYSGHYVPEDAKRYESVLKTRFNEPVAVS